MGRVFRDGLKRKKEKKRSFERDLFDMDHHIPQIDDGKVSPRLSAPE
jgi:hypothetical protein